MKFMWFVSDFSHLFLLVVEKLNTNCVIFFHELFFFLQRESLLQTVTSSEVPGSVYSVLSKKDYIYWSDDDKMISVFDTTV